jgi:hypothetical protein
MGVGLSSFAEPRRGALTPSPGIKNREVGLILSQLDVKLNTLVDIFLPNPKILFITAFRDFLLPY